MSYAYHPLSRVGAFTKGNASVTTYQTQWDLYGVPVTQCSTCLASAASRCTCKADKAEAKRLQREAGILATQVNAAQVERATVDKRLADKVRLHEDMIERHLTRLATIPKGLRNGYLSNVPKAIRTELLSYVA